MKIELNSKEMETVSKIVRKMKASTIFVCPVGDGMVELRTLDPEFCSLLLVRPTAITEGLNGPIEMDAKKFIDAVGNGDDPTTSVEVRTVVVGEDCQEMNKITIRRAPLISVHFTNSRILAIKEPKMHLDTTVVLTREHLMKTQTLSNPSDIQFLANDDGLTVNDQLPCTEDPPQPTTELRFSRDEVSVSGPGAVTRYDRYYYLDCFALKLPRGTEIVMEFSTDYPARFNVAYDGKHLPEMRYMLAPRIRTE